MRLPQRTVTGIQLDHVFKVDSGVQHVAGAHLILFYCHQQSKAPSHLPSLNHPENPRLGCNLPPRSQARPCKCGFSGSLPRRGCFLPATPTPCLTASLAVLDTADLFVTQLLEAMLSRLPSSLTGCVFSVQPPLTREPTCRFLTCSLCLQASKLQYQQRLDISKVPSSSPGLSP